MKKLATVLLVCLMVFACNGDGGSDSTGPTEIFQGTFALQSITVTQEGVTITIGPPAATGSLLVRPDNTYTLTLNAPEAGVTETSSGTWTMSGNRATATDNDGTVTTVMVSEDRNQLSFTQVEEGVAADVTFVRA